MTEKLPDNLKSLVSLSYTRSNDRLQLQASVASASDQRSLVFATLSIASAALIFGALKDTQNSSLGTYAAMSYCISGVSASLSALPSKLYSSGSKASEIRSALENELDYDRVVLGLCENNDFYIDENEKRAASNAHFFRFSIVWFVIGTSLALYGFHASI